MITRGHYLGEIIDDLSAITEQVKLRNRLGLTDLTVYAENFFRDLLNVLLHSDFKNLNESRSNEPGLDLGCSIMKMAVQVTSTATAEKVNKTLKKITPAQLEQYEKFIVLVIGKRQTSYALDTDQVKKCKFDQKNIWDINTLARKAVSLEIDALRQLHQIMRKESSRLKVELEIPDEEGRYPTSGYDDWEKLAKPQIGSGNNFIRWTEDRVHRLTPEERKEVAAAISALSDTLSKLPRITREFFAMLHERRDREQTRRSGHRVGAHLVFKTAERIYNGDLAGELEILRHAGLVEVDGEDPYELGAAEIQVHISHNDDLDGGFIDFVEENDLSFRSVIGSVNFSAF